MKKRVVNPIGELFQNSHDNKRYHTFHHYLKTAFGGKVGKISLDAGFTCPNIDGKVGRGGCIYCSPRGSGDFAGMPGNTISQQIGRQREIMWRKWPGARCIAYFQAHSNTYAPLEMLKQKYEEALSCTDIVGLFIATRPDVLETDVLDYLEELGSRTWLVVELGLQTIHDKTATMINRCHTYHQFLEGFEALKRRNIDTCVHIINYLPGETRKMMLETAREVGKLNPFSVKIHMLHILKNTAILPLYNEGKVPLPEMEEYVRLVCDQLELLPPGIVLQRLTGDAPVEDLIAPEWVVKKLQVLNNIDKEMAARNSVQGIRA